MSVHSEQCQLFSGGWRPGPSGNIGAAAQALLVFGCAGLLTDEVRRQLREAYPNALPFGCSTAGELLGARLEDGTLAVTAISLDHGEVRGGQAPIRGPGGGFEAAAEAVESLPAEGLRHAFVLAPGNYVNGSELVAGINSVLPPGASASGGFAGADRQVNGSMVWCAGEPDPHRVVALGFYGSRLKVGRGTGGGWFPFGPERLVTRSKGQTVYEFDGRSALSLYKQYLGDYAAGLPFTGLRFPIGLRTDGSERWQLRVINGIDEVNGGLTFDGHIPVGTSASIMVGKAERLVDGAAAAARESLDELGSQAQLSIVVGCYGRRVVLGQHTEEELEGMREAYGAPTTLAGFYSYGEISRNGEGPRAELYNQTMTVTALAEA